MRDFIRAKSELLIIILIVLIQSILRIVTCFSHLPMDWLTLLFDILIFVLTNIFICKISNKLFKCKIYSMFLCILNGFSAIFFVSSSYPITYELTNLFVLLITYFHLILWRKKHISFLTLFAIMLTVFIGNLIHYSFFVCALVLFVIYIVKCVKSRNYSNLARYITFMLLGFTTSFLVGKSLYSHVLLGLETTSKFKLFNVNLEKLKYITIINYGFFHKLFFLFVAIVGIVCYKKSNRKIKWNSATLIFSIPIVFYTLLVFMCSPEITIKYLIPIYSVTLILILYMLKKFLFEHLANGEAIFVLILLSTIYAYNYLTGCLHLTLI